MQMQIQKWKYPRIGEMLEKTRQTVRLNNK